MENRTRRGRYIDLSKSPIEYVYNDSIFKFSSYKKRDIFLKRVMESIKAIDKLNGRIFKYTKDNTISYDIRKLYDNICQKVYDDMKYK